MIDLSPKKETHDPIAYISALSAAVVYLLVSRREEIVKHSQDLVESMASKAELEGCQAHLKEIDKLLGFLLV